MEPPSRSAAATSSSPGRSNCATWRLVRSAWSTWPTWHARSNAPTAAIATAEYDPRMSPEGSGLGTAYRTHTCGELRATDVGADVALPRWGQRGGGPGAPVFFL